MYDGEKGPQRWPPWAPLLSLLLFVGLQPKMRAHRMVGVHMWITSLSCGSLARARTRAQRIGYELGYEPTSHARFALEGTGIAVS